MTPKEKLMQILTDNYGASYAYQSELIMKEFPNLCSDQKSKKNKSFISINSDGEIEITKDVVISFKDYSGKNISVDAYEVNHE